MAGAGESCWEEINGDLYRAVLPFFKRVIPAVALTDLACISAMLTTEQIEKVRQKDRAEGDTSAARQLLEFLYKKPRWFETLMEALSDPAVKLAEYRPQFAQIQAKVHQEWMLRTPERRRADPPQLPERGNLPPLRGRDSGGASGGREGSPTRSTGLSFPEQESSPSGPPEDTLPKQLSIVNVSGDGGNYSTVRIPRLEDESWYVGKASRNEADAMLENCCAGTFLVRFNATEQRHSLYVRGHGHTLHLMINKKSQSNGAVRYFLDVSAEGFDTIQGLVHYYSTHDFTTDDEPNKICLLHPLSLTQGLGDSETAVNGFRAGNLSVSNIKDSNA